MEKGYAIYARVSTNQQDLDHQVEACKNFCDSRGIKIHHIYADIGSGKTFFNRPNFLRMVEDIKHDLVDGVVVFRLDRLGRNLKEMIEFLGLLEERKKQIISIHESFDTTTAIGRAIIGFMLVLAQLEREMISEATKQRLAALKEGGKHVGRPKGAKDKKPRRKAGYFLEWERRRKMKKQMKNLKMKNQDEK